MTALLKSLAAGFQGDSVRRALLDEALADGLPGPRAEAWKYTSLRQLERRSFAVVEHVPAIDPAMLADIPAPRVVFANGHVIPELSLLDELHAGISLSFLSEALADDGEAARFLHRRFEHNDEVFARLNAALANQGVLLRAESKVQSDLPVHLVFIAAGEEDTDRAWHLRNLIELRDGASMTIVEHHFAATPHANLANTLTQVHLGQGARLMHARVQADDNRATHLLRTDAVLAKAADYHRIDLELGAAMSRHELNVRLEGDTAKLTADGVLLTDGSRHLDTRLGIDHAALDTSCGLNWRSLGSDRGRVVFHGGIMIRAGADGTDARLSNKNLLLSDNAEIDTQPVLEIYADEVQAAHGATVGQLDPEALFYMRSRGLSELAAQRLLISGFCRAPVMAVADAKLRDWLLKSLDAALDSPGARVG